MIPDLPAPLRAIEAEALRFQQTAYSSSEIDFAWQNYLQQARQRVPGLTIDESQATVCLGDLSPGCQACKDGTWDCIFITQKCNLNCSFCYSPKQIPVDFIGSAFGTTPDMIARNYARTHITGISFSGGEPFLEAARLIEWVTGFRQCFPESYLWIYTNGTLVDESVLRELGQWKVDEIRFNLAASGYDHKGVLANVRLAARYFDRLTVEIPAIPEHQSQVLDCLEKWIQAGVRFLNLHELIYEPGTNSWQMDAHKMDAHKQKIVLADGHVIAVNPDSQGMILDVLEHVQRWDLPLAVNHCSLQNKISQIRGRRQSLLPLTQASHEKLVEGEWLESICMYGQDDQIVYCHPDQLPQMRARFPDFGWVRLTRTAPLSIDDGGRWVKFEPGVPHG
jgi:pyruvate formate-lyase activating enzyme-like uncharacterized protein